MVTDYSTFSVPSATDWTATRRALQTIQLRLRELSVAGNHIANPSGGGVQDAEARTAINAILVILENLKLTETS